MKKKSLLEKRGLLIDELEQVTNSEKFDRSVFDAKRSEIVAIDKELRTITEVKQVEKKELGGNKMGELRGIVKGEVEARALTVGNVDSAGVTVGETISSDIIKKLEEIAPAYAKAQKYQNRGYLKLLKEKDVLGQAVFLGEGESAEATDFALESVTLGFKRLYTEVALTMELVNNASFDLEAYAKQVIERRIAKTLDRAILFGAGDKAPKGAIAFAPATCEVARETAGAISADDLVGLLMAMNEVHSANAVFVMNRADLTKIMKLKDATGQFICVPDFATGVNGYRLLGKQVMIDEVATTIALINIENAVAVNVYPEIGVQVYNDSAYTKKGLVGLGINVLCDAALINEDAVRVLK